MGLFVRKNLFIAQSRLVIISFVFLVSHILLIIVLGSITAFAPDESGYVAIFDRLYTSDFTFGGQGGWGIGNVYFLRVIYFPAKIFSFLGCSSLVSIRLLSLLCSYIAIYLLIKRNGDYFLMGRNSLWWVFLAFFSPSIFLWTSLGLRESFIFLWLVTLFHFTSEVLKHPNWRHTSILIFSSSALYLTKDYLYVFILVSYLVTILFFWIRSKRLEKSHLILISLILLPLIIFPAKTTGIFKSGVNFISLKIVVPNETGNEIGNEIGNETGNETGNKPIATGGFTLHALVSQLDSNKLLSRITEQTGVKKFLEDREEKSYSLSNSKAYQQISSQLSAPTANFGDPLSIVKGSAHFLFVPIPLVDNGSFFLNLQSYESPIWYLFYALLFMVVFRLIRGSIKPDFTTIVSIAFTLIFIVASSLVEVNDGTSVRHRAVLLISILVVIVNQRKGKPKELTRITSRG